MKKFVGVFDKTMYEIKFEDGKWWIKKDEKRLDILGGFDDPISPEIILKEIIDEERSVSRGMDNSKD